MQTQTMTGIYYTGMGNCFQTIYKEEGIRAFYRGVAAPMASYGLIKSITFGSYGNTCDRATTLPTRQPPSIPSSGPLSPPLRPNLPSSPPLLTTTAPQLATSSLDFMRKRRIANGDWTGKHPLMDLFIGGCVGGFACTVVMAPSDRIKVRCGALDAAGVAGNGAGHAVSAVSAVSAVGAATGHPSHHPHTSPQVQMQLAKSEGKPFKGVLDCGRFIVRNEGVFTKTGLFRGWTATALRDVPGMSGYYIV